MKCAAEMEIIRMKNAKINEERAIEEAKKKKEEIYQRTIKVCEEIGKNLEGMARAGKPIQWIDTLLLTGYFDDNKVYLAIPTFKDYADRRLSYNFGEEIDPKVMVNWFAKYCFKITSKKVKVWHYGWGTCYAYNVTITPDPKC